MNTIVLLSAIAASAVSVDFSRTCGEIKPLHGVNCSPVRHETVDKVYNQAQSELGEAGIPYCRLHDVAGRYGLHHYVDIPNVFPNLMPMRMIRRIMILPLRMRTSKQW